MAIYDSYIDNAYFVAVAINYSGYQDVIVQVRDLEPGWENYGYFHVVLESLSSISSFDIYSDSMGFDDRATGSYYSDTGREIDSETEYQVRVYFYPYGGGSGDRVSIYANSVGSGIYYVIINSGGQPPSPIQQPTFTAYIINSNQIQIDLSNYGDVSGFVYEINGVLYYPFADSPTYTSSALSDGTYEVGAYYDNGAAFIKTSGGSRYIYLTIGGSGGDNWSYDSVSPMAISTSTTPRSESQSFTAQNGLFFTFYCDQNGTMDIYSSSPSGGPLKSYLSDINNSYDPDNGIPYSYDYSDTGSFSYTINVTSGEVYYLWVTSENNSSFTLNIDFTATIIAPTYTASVSGNSIIFNVFNRGSYYLRYYVKLTSNNNEIYDSYPYQTVTSKTINNLSWSTSYTVNVGYSEYSTGNVTWIGSQTLTTGSAPVTNDGKVWIFNGSSWVRAKPYIFTGSSWEPASAYVFNGSQWKKTKG